MTRSLSMPISPVDELAEACSLSAEQYGAFMLLRAFQWQYGALPVDDDQLARIARVAPEGWSSVAAIIRPRFGRNWQHEPTHLARQKAMNTRERLSNAGSKGGQAKAKAKPKPGESQPTAKATSLATSPVASMAISQALARLKPEVQPRKCEASDPAQAGDEPAYPAISDPEAALAWLQEKDVFPADLDELQRLLMAGKLTRAILEASKP